MKACVSSIQNQTFTNYEVLIIDGNSSDDTHEYLQTLDSPFQFISEPDRGVYDAMNKGISQARGSWLYFMGSDDLFFKTTVLASVFKKRIDPQIDLIIGNIKYDCEGREGRLLNKHDGIRKSSWSFRLWFSNEAHHQGLFYKSTVFERKLYNVKYKVLADYDLNLQLFREETHVKLIDTIVALCGTNGLSKIYSWNMYKEEIDFKSNQSTLLLKPLFYMLGVLKYLLKKVQS